MSAASIDHRTIFAIYASSQSWTAVHLGQFVGMVIITFGLVALFFTLNVRSANRAGAHASALGELLLRQPRLLAVASSNLPSGNIKLDATDGSTR
jgi:hypothetical protein